MKHTSHQESGTDAPCPACAETGESRAESWAIKLSNSHPGWYRIVREDAKGHELGDVAEEICEARYARLLRTAPDLLDALRAAVAFMEEEAENRQDAGADMTDYLKEVNDPLDQARYALAKVDGL